MRAFRNIIWLRSFLLPLTTALWIGVTSCTSWKPVKQPVPETIGTERPDEVRIYLADGGQVELRSPRIIADSLEGLVQRGRYRDDVTRVRYPLSEITSISSKQTDGWKTLGLVGGITLGALFVAALASIDMGVPDSRGSSGGSSSSSSGSDTQFSCPLVYAWDGARWRLDSGTFGGAIFEPLARTDVDGLDHATAENGRVRLRLANELNETDYVDAIDLLYVDHQPGQEVVPDGAGQLHVVGSLAEPLSARDDRGRDVLEVVRAADGRGWESSPTGRDTAVAADVRSAIELEFRRPPGATEATLVVHGNNTAWASWLLHDFVSAHGRDTDAWYASMNSNPEAAAAVGRTVAREAFLSASIEMADGWQPRGLIWEAGPEIAKRQALHLELGAVAGDVIRVRLESVPLYWNLDQVGIHFPAEATVGAANVTADATVVGSARAVMESDGRDVRSLLAAEDGTELALETGDAAQLEFDVPPVPDGMSRSYLIATTGWYRIHVRAPDKPPRPEVSLIGTDPLAISRLSVARLNEALKRLEGPAR
jgi:hypothetical protein